MTLNVDINQPEVLAKVTSDKFGLVVSNEWKRLINKYTPRNTGMLMNTVELLPFQIKYLESYAHYMYEGTLYVSPTTGSSWAEFGEEKVPTGTNLTYSTSENPYATDHWDTKAAQAGELSKLYRSLNDFLATGRN